MIRPNEKFYSSGYFMVIHKKNPEWVGYIDILKKSSLGLCWENGEAFIEIKLGPQKELTPLSDCHVCECTLKQDSNKYWIFGGHRVYFDATHLFGRVIPEINEWLVCIRSGEWVLLDNINRIIRFADLDFDVEEITIINHSLIPEKD